MKNGCGCENVPFGRTDGKWKKGRKRGMETSQGRKGREH
jgi:hypothetical protein